MNVRAHIERLEKAATSEALRQLTLELGGSLPRLRRRELGELETALAKAVVPKDDRDAAVMRKTLSLFISGALERGARTAQRARELDVAALGLKPVWRRILAAVDPESVFRPKDLRVRADIATRELAKMEERGLVEEIPAAESLLADQRGKYLRLTPFGEEVQRRVLESAPRRRKRPSAERAQHTALEANAFRRSLQEALAEAAARPAAPPAPRLDDAFAAASLDEWRRRAARDHYGLLGCDDDCAFDDVRAGAREARRELEALQAQPLDDAQRAALAEIIDRLAAAAQTLESPARRAEYDAARGNYRGVARCIAAGLGAADLEKARRRHLAERGQSEVGARAHAASAQAHLRGGRAAEAMRELGRALEADPLNLAYHRLYWSLRWRTPPASVGGAASTGGWR